MTVVIPCYNYGHFLTACVMSVLGQDGVEVDALIMNDASTDDTSAIAHRLAARDPRVTVIDHSVNIGHIATYNEGLAAAEGDYVVLLSADDMLTRGSLARATAVMEARSDVGLVYGHPCVVHGDSIPSTRIDGRGAIVWDGPDWISAQCRRGLSAIYSPEVCVRASVQHAVGGYTAALPHSGDVEMWLRIASVTNIARVNGAQAYRRMHAESMMQTRFAGLLNDLRGRRDAYESFFRGSGQGLERGRHDLATARRRLAAEALDHVCERLRAGDVDVDELAQFVAFAREVQAPEEPPARQWREFRRLSASRGDTSSLLGPWLRYCAVRRDLTGRWRWWRWRVIGV